MGESRRRRDEKVRAPHCPYCGEQARLADCSEVYRCPAGKYGNVWVCPNFPKCDSYVGCHKGGMKPLGRMANKELRKAKSAAHRMFDALWKAKIDRQGVSRKDARGSGYEWLGKQLGIDPSRCHIGEMDLEECRAVVAACAPFFKLPEAPK